MKMKSLNSYFIIMTRKLLILKMRMMIIINVTAIKNGILKIHRKVSLFQTKIIQASWASLRLWWWQRRQMIMAKKRQESRRWAKFNHKTATFQYKIEIKILCLKNIKIFMISLAVYKTLDYKKIRLSLNQIYRDK